MCMYYLYTCVLSNIVYIIIKIILVYLMYHCMNGLSEERNLIDAAPGQRGNSLDEICTTNVGDCCVHFCKSMLMMRIIGMDQRQHHTCTDFILNSEKGVSKYNVRRSTCIYIGNNMLCLVKSISDTNYFIGVDFDKRLFLKKKKPSYFMSIKIISMCISED